VRLSVVALGRMKAGPEAQLFADYARRLNPPLALKELEDRKTASADERKRREAALILAAIPKGARLVALDGRGTMLSSEDLAARLSRWEGEGASEACFVIGGADGLDRSVVERADFVYSLGPATWPHMLVRIMLAEQLFRARSILAGHPYHRA
jgi:23S rRNA (pseudouridine1915-N3)-methyltransferase